jgi:hypothetical protein
MSYNCHTSKKLKDCFIKQPWQGNNPKKARFLFVGLDANFDANIENNATFFKEEILMYLEDGVGYWQKRGFHHPFMHPYYSGSGRLYHERFAKIGFKPYEADLVSFVELLHVPTTGGNNLDAFDLCPTHLRKLADWFNCGSARYIFFVSSKVTELVRRTRNTHDLELLPPNQVKMDDDFKDLKVLRKKNGQTIYGIYHFSLHYREQVIVLERQIAQIREIVHKFVEGQQGSDKPEMEKRIANDEFDIFCERVVGKTGWFPRGKTSVVLVGLTGRCKINRPAGEDPRLFPLNRDEVNLGIRACRDQNRLINTSELKCAGISSWAAAPLYGLLKLYFDQVGFS